MHYAFTACRHTQLTASDVTDSSSHVLALSGTRYCSSVTLSISTPNVIAHLGWSDPPWLDNYGAAI